MKPNRPEGEGRARVAAAPDVERKLPNLRPDLFAEMPALLLDTGEAEGGWYFERWPVRTRRTPLIAGDYSLDGFADRIAVERKALGDLFGCVGHGRERFASQIQRLTDMAKRGGRAALIFEATWNNVMAGPRDVCGQRVGTMDAGSVIGTLFAWQSRTGIAVVPGKDRRTAESVCLRWLQWSWIEMTRTEGDGNA